MMKDQTPISVKICGITQIKQALAIASMGADAIGLIGVKNSPRFINESQRRKLFNELAINAPLVERVLVTANMTTKEIFQNLSGVGLPTIIQLHGNESQQRCKELKKAFPGITFWKAFRIQNNDDLNTAKNFQDSVDAILIDAWKENILGGTGEKVPRKFIEKINFKLPWWLAGGICPDSVNEILLHSKPFGIDASSKVEKNPGIKDLKKVKNLIENVKKHQQIL